LVSLTACPHLDCQHVALVCTDRGAPVALTLERFVEPRVRSFNVIDALFIFVGFIIYIVTPMTMWAFAWRDLGLFVLVVLLTGPAAGIGVCALFAIVVDVRNARRDRRQLVAVRRRAFARARWQNARCHAR
jgi:hypothetical protein